MSHALTISDTAYESLKQIAERQGQSPEAIIEGWIAATNSGDNRPRYETEDWFRHLGVSEERIRKAREGAASEDK
jgi:hypothetical protein